MKKIFIGLIAFLLVLGMVFAAKPNSVEKVNPTGKIVSIPSNAVEVSPGVFYLGKAIDNGRVVEGYAIIHKKDGNAKPSGVGVKKGTLCYGFLSSGAKWKTIEPYIVDPTNTRGLSSAFVTDNLAADIAKWETAATKNILGDENITGAVDGADTISPDNKNEVYFGSVDSPGAIAVTIVWGIFSGPTFQRKLVEWDQVYDQVDFDWGIGEATKMDFENIATHELGHSVGMADLYTSTCSQETMYGYASNGEINKRDLNTGDIAGVRKLYS